MQPEASSPPTVFVLPDHSAGGLFALGALLGLLGGVVAVVWYAIRDGQGWYLLAEPLLLGLGGLVWRALMTSTPSSLRREEDTLVLTDVPSFRIWVDRTCVPLIIKPRVVIPMDQFHLEWLGEALTWNDLQRGRSVHLAWQPEAKPLLAWLAAQGIEAPPRGF